MTLDLFADPEPAALAPEPVTPESPPVTRDRSVTGAPVTRASHPMQPIPGEPNRWHYKGETVRYDKAAEHTPGTGRWSAAATQSRPALRGHTHAEICGAIDAAQAAQSLTPET